MPEREIPEFHNCDPNILLADARCLMPPCRTGWMHDAIDIGVRVGNLAALGGTDYTADLNKLLTDARAWQALNEMQRKAVSLRIDILNAVNNGMVMDMSQLDAFLSKVECYQCLGHETRKALLLYLKCRINALTWPD